MNVLVLNCRNSTTTFSVCHASHGHEHISGMVQGHGTPEATLEFDHEGHKESRPTPGAGRDAALRAIFELLHEVGLADRLIGVGQDRKSTRLNSSHVKISY